MKSVIQGLFTAFSLYSAIPMPKTGWDRENRRYALCFFPLVGAVIGVLQILWFWLCRRAGLAESLYAAVAALLPVAVSGGIHMDGFIDTMDALSSHGLREKKLQILSDPHVGAFGVVFCAGYLLLSFGLWSQIYHTPALIALPAGGYVFSRALSALTIAAFPCARDSGLVHAFSQSASKEAAVASAWVFAAGVALYCIAVSPLWGGALTGISALVFILHRRFCLWEFGGNTGDLAGFFLQNLELLWLIAAVAGGASKLW